MTAVLDHTLPQHMVALKQANRVRLQAAELKGEVAGGTMTVRAALYDERSHSVTVLDLLMAQRRWGRERSRRFLTSIEYASGEAMPVVIAETKRVGELTPRQRHVLARMIAAVV
jgi:hypothetical protein